VVARILHERLVSAVPVRLQRLLFLQQAGHRQAAAKGGLWLSFMLGLCQLVQRVSWCNGVDLAPLLCPSLHKYAATMRERGSHFVPAAALHAICFEDMRMACLTVHNLPALLASHSQEHNGDDISLGHKVCFY
jgi:hypothetical protein